MSVNIQLDVPALERLINGDKEMEVKLKDGVILNFVDKKLRGLLKDEHLQTKITELKRDIDKSIDKTVADEIGKMKSVAWNSSYFEFHTEFRDKVRASIQKEIDVMVDAHIRTQIELAIKRFKIEDMVKYAVDTRIATWSKDAINKKAGELLNTALKSAK